MEKHQKLLPGQLDPSFGEGGYVLYPPGEESFQVRISIRTSGKILAARAAGNAIELTQFLSDGSPDTDFGDQGKRRVEIPGVISIKTLQFAIQKGRDRSVFAIQYTSLQGIIDEVMLVGLLSDGFIDPSFGYGGFTPIPIYWDEVRYEIVQLAVEDNGMVLALRERIRYGSSIASFTADGQLKQGIVDVGEYLGMMRVAIASEGKVLVAGVPLQSAEFKMMRYLESGVLDMEYGVDGVFKYGVPGYYGPQIANIALPPDGKALIAGSFAQTSNSSVAMLMRLSEDGTADSSFNNGEALLFDYGGENSNNISSMALQSDGQIVLLHSGKWGSRKINLARFLPIGALDPNFGTNGMVNLDYSGGDVITSTLALQEDGKILIGANAYVLPITKLLMARLLAE